MGNFELFGWQKVKKLSHELKHGPLFQIKRKKPDLFQGRAFNLKGEGGLVGRKFFPALKGLDTGRWKGISGEKLVPDMLGSVYPLVFVS